MNYNVIIATDKYGGYARYNRIPWHIPNELKYFNMITTYSESNLLPIIIMGRNTWESLPIKPLPKRLNIVISKKLYNERDKGDDVIFLDNIFSMFKLLEENYFYNDKYVIGGYNLINEILDINYQNVKRIYISQICENYECDLFLNISDHLLKYSCMSYSKKMDDRIKNKEVSIIFKKYYLKNIDKPDYDIFYKDKQKYKLLRIYESDNIKLINDRVKIPDEIKSKLGDNPYNTLFHGKYI
jgi:dihydrofolate reductase